MSKICQCKKDAIKKICLLHRNNFLLNCKENGFWFWLIDNLQKAYESDCVCEKKDDGNGPKDFMVIHVDEGLPNEHAEMICMKCNNRATVQLEEKQSQSCGDAIHMCKANQFNFSPQLPCKHNFQLLTFGGNFSRPKVYCCMQEGCGLVTGLNPNNK